MPAISHTYYSHRSMFSLFVRTYLIKIDPISCESDDMFISLISFIVSSPFGTLAIPLSRIVYHSMHSSWSRPNLGRRKRNPLMLSCSIASHKHQIMTQQPLHHAYILSTTPHSISLAAARIRAGNLVSFPTETVYGLGCDALNPSAVRKVFQAKERPLTDPLILHVNEPKEAWALWAAFTSSNKNESLVLSTLTLAFWPGPLTLVAKAAPHVPDLVMANTGFVACRSPSHPTARALIQEAEVPIAAPSANKFGHVSPTTAQHVWDDLQQEDVWILDPTRTDDNEPEISSRSPDQEVEPMTVCQVGVESTVAKIEMNPDGHGGKILILRHGAISARDIQNHLIQAQLDTVFVVLDNKMQATKEHVQHVAPGQCIRHYSPNVPSFMVDVVNPNTVLEEEEIQLLRHSVVLDYGSRLFPWKEYALAYQDLSEGSDPNEAASRVFALLRWSEEVEDAQRVFFPKLGHNDSLKEEVNPLLQALTDRLNRAASGKVLSSLKQTEI